MRGGCAVNGYQVCLVGLERLKERLVVILSGALVDVAGGQDVTRAMLWP